jgi:SAM-dependent methyltransferase
MNEAAPETVAESTIDPAAPLPGESADGLVEQVRERYASAARAVAQSAGSPDGCGCGSCGCDDGFGAVMYQPGELTEVPKVAQLASLGCGNPVAVAELRPGETVLDLGSGAGLDLVLSARRVGMAGKVYGLDMTEEMLALARQTLTDAGVGNAELLRGRIEAIPLPAQTVDVVISNCVVNLSVDKPRVAAEMFRVLRPGGRVGISDVVAEDRLTPAERAQRGDHAGCIAGALSVSEYRLLLTRAGFENVEVRFSHEVADGLHGAIVRARRPVA